MAEAPLGGDPVFSSPISSGDEVIIPPTSFFFLLENGVDRLLLESGDIFLTEAAM